MKLGRYILISILCGISFFGNAQIAPVVNDTSKHTKAVMDTSKSHGIVAGMDTAKQATVAIFAPPPVPPAPDSNIQVYEPYVVKSTVQKLYDYQRYTHGTSPGFRVQIYFSQESNTANNTRSNFSGKYPGTPSYVSYKQPYFRVSVGDFRTKLEAVCFLNKVKKDYPAAFVVADKITPPPLQ